jgi:6-phosphogluconolactonase (cycloisomerase 2 family)
VLNEVSSSLTVHSLPKDAEPELLQRFSILPPEGEERKEDMTAAEILLLPPLDPRAPSLLLCTNRYTTREEGDAIALFAVGADGTVQRTETGWYRGVGKHVRALDGDKTGRFIATAARDGGGVVILERVGDGTEVVEVARLSDVENVVDALWMD